MAAPPARIVACDCLTPFGRASTTLAALDQGRIALQPRPALGEAGGDAVPLALLEDRALDETVPPRWLTLIRDLLRDVPGGDWGTARRPVVVTSSNFGVGSLYAFRQTGERRHLDFGTPFASVDALRESLGWGHHVTAFSHACVTAHLGLLHATRLLEAGLADRVLLVSFDLVSPFVAGGFHALKILNGAMPAPYQDREIGAIGLGDGAAYAILAPGDSSDGRFAILGQSLHNEMYHFTANRADGAGFEACLQDIRGAAADLRVWIKGHGTGTLEAGRLEAHCLSTAFPRSPLVSWKGSLGHTLGSCGLVELAIVCAAMDAQRSPGTPGSAAPLFAETVALESFRLHEFDAALCTSNAFGGAHAALLVAPV